MKTPQQSYPALAKALGIGEVYLKREDLHPYGSHKGRSIPHMIKTYAKRDGMVHFVMSSSGNAALAAIHTVLKHNLNNPNCPISLTIFVGKKIAKEKFDTITSAIANANSSMRDKIKLIETHRPKQSAFQLGKEQHNVFLRQSTDDLALEGYYELADELIKIPNLAAVFIPTSSGTTAEALGKAFEEIEKHIEIHIVQTEACHPIVDEIRKSENIEEHDTRLRSATDGQARYNPPAGGQETEENRNMEEMTERKKTSIAGAIVDRVAHRKKKVSAIIENTNGAGWIVSDEEITDAMRIVKKTIGIEISPNSALSVAGLQQAIRQGWKSAGAVACLITGR